jgi:hypothetical protein
LPIEKVIAGERSSETQRQHADYQQQRSQYEIDPLSIVMYLSASVPSQKSMNVG